MVDAPLLLLVRIREGGSREIVQTRFASKSLNFSRIVTSVKRAIADNMGARSVAAGAFWVHILINRLLSDAYESTPKFTNSGLGQFLQGTTIDVIADCLEQLSSEAVFHRKVSWRQTFKWLLKCCYL